MGFKTLRSLILTSFFLGLTSHFATASTNANDLEQKLFQAASNDPNIERQISQMISRIENGQVDQIIQSTIQALFQIAPNGQLSEAAMDLSKKRTVARNRARQLGQYLIYDLDGDGGISKSEMDGLFGSGASQVISLRGIADTNRDGDISAEELRAAATQQAERRQDSHQYGYLMAFDLNDDGLVDPNEVLKAIRILAGEELTPDGNQSEVNVTSGTFADAAEEPATDNTATTNPDGLPVEVHMVGIYEPRETRQSNGLAKRSPVPIKVDRPGVSVTLVLGSYDPTRWIIETSEGTQVDTVIAHDRNRVRGEVILNGKKIAVTFRKLPLAYQSRGNRFQPFHEAATKAAGVSKAASFHGAYRAPEDGFVIDDAPGVPTRAEVDAALTAQAFRAADLSPKLRDAFEGKTIAPGSRWELRDEGFVGRDENGKKTVHKLPLDAPEVSWPMGTAYDPKSQMLWGVSLGGVGYLYQYDIANNRWTARSMNNVDAGGLIFDPATGHLISTPGPHGLGNGYLTLDRTGKVLSSFKVSPKDYPGLIDTYDPGNGPSPRMVPIMIEGDLLLVRAEARHSPRQSRGSRWHYLVNLQSGEVRLVR